MNTKLLIAAAYLTSAIPSISSECVKYRSLLEKTKFYKNNPNSTTILAGYYGFVFGIIYPVNILK